MKPKLILVLLLFLTPLALALDCDDVANKQWCEDILDSDLSDEEKEYLLADIISNEKHYPDHELIREWNKKILTDTTPEGITKQDEGHIKNAWMKLLAVMPSVTYDDVLFIDRQGEVLTAFNHEVEIPSETVSGDCKTKYYLKENEGTLKVYVNNRLQGTGSLVNYFASLPDNARVKIKAKYTIKVKIKIKHYKREKEYYERDGKRYYRWVCEYDSREYEKDSLVLEDKITVRIHRPKLEASFTVTDKYLDTVKAEFGFNDVVNAELTFYDSYFKQHNFIFSEVFGPLNVLTIKAEKQTSKEHKNLVYSGDNPYEIILANTNGCKIKLYDFFEKRVLPCDLSFSSLDFSVETDKTVYEDNETIKVEIGPSGKGYTVDYAGKRFFTGGALELKAVYPHNRISVQYKDKVFHKLIHVKNEKPLNMFFSLAIFGMVNYTLIGLVRKYWGVIL